MNMSARLSGQAVETMYTKNTHGTWYTDETILVGHVGVGGEKGRIFHELGIAPCVPASTYKDPIKVALIERT